MGPINSLKHLLPKRLLRTLYYSMVNPFLTYGLLLWGSARKKHLKQIETLQKRAIRSITLATYNEHSLPLFKQMRILKLNELYLKQINSFMCCYNMNLLPLPLQSMYIKNRDIHSYETRQSNNPRTVPHRNHVLSNSFVCKGPDQWNKLPNDVRNAPSILSFKSRLANLYLSNY